MREISRKFSKEEILIALQESNNRKAPGLDGFNIGWIKKFWPFIEDMVLNFFENFYNKTWVPQGSNSSFLVLIPKNNDPDSWKDYRPISLFNFSFKILLKIRSFQKINMPS